MQEGGGWMSREDGVGRQRIGCRASTAEKGSGTACPKWAAVGACRERKAANRTKDAPKKMAAAVEHRQQASAKRVSFWFEEWM